MNDGPDDLGGLLRDLGTDEAEIAEAEEDGTLALLAVEQLLAQHPTHTLDEVCERTGVGPEQIALIWRTLGYAQPKPGEASFTDGDIEILGQVGAMMEAGVTSPEMVLQLSRVIGSSMARVASAHVDLIAARAAERRRAEAEEGVELIGVVGFADLVGFTALSQQLNEAELAAVVDQFEVLCFDVITEGGGRVVKMIGDEVMFTVDSPVAAAEMALALSEGTRDADELSDVRVGLAYGTLLERESDLFGPVVNLASRITKIAFPGSVVVSRELYELLGGAPGYVMRSMRHRYLKNIGRVPLYVLRRARGSESRFADRRQALRDAVRARVSPAVADADADADADAGPGSPGGDGPRIDVG